MCVCACVCVCVRVPCVWGGWGGGRGVWRIGYDGRGHVVAGGRLAAAADSGSRARKMESGQRRAIAVSRPRHSKTWRDAPWDERPAVLLFASLHSKKKTTGGRSDVQEGTPTTKTASPHVSIIQTRAQCRGKTPGTCRRPSADEHGAKQQAQQDQRLQHQKTDTTPATAINRRPALGHGAVLAPPAVARRPGTGGAGADNKHVCEQRLRIPVLVPLVVRRRLRTAQTRTRPRSIPADEDIALTSVGSYRKGVP